MITKIGKIAGNGLMILIFIIGIYTLFGILSVSGTDAEGNELYNDTAISVGINASYYIMIIGGILALLFWVVRLVLDFKKNIKTLINIGVFLVIVAIVYATATDQLPLKTTTFMLESGLEADEIPTVAKRVDLGMKLTTTLIFIAAISIVVGWAATMVKRFR